MAYLKKRVSASTYLQCYVVNNSMTLDVRTGAHISQLEATLRNGCPGASRYLSLPEALSFLLAAVLWRRNFEVFSPWFGVSGSGKIEHIFGVLGSASPMDSQHDYGYELGTSTKSNTEVCTMLTRRNGHLFLQKRHLT